MACFAKRFINLLKYTYQKWLPKRPVRELITIRVKIFRLTLIREFSRQDLRLPNCSVFVIEDHDNATQPSTLRQLSAAN